MDLVAYQRLICEASRHASSEAWLLYDRKFRMVAATNPQLHWGQKHSELWLECFVGSLAPGSSKRQGAGPRSPEPLRPSYNQYRRPCTYCNSVNNFPHNCPQNPFNTKSSSGNLESPSSTRLPTRSSSGDNFQKPRPSPSFAPPVCRDFNSPGGCQRKVCCFRHVCGICSNHHARGECPFRTSRT